jgi:fused signal recognition particle receptor
MTGFFKKLFNRVTGRGAAEPAAPEPVAEPVVEPVAEPVAEATAEPAAPVAAPKPPRPAAKPTVKPKPRPRPVEVEAAAPAPAVAEALPPPMEILPEPLPLAAAEIVAGTVMPPHLPIEEPAPRRGWFARLRQGLAKSSRSLSSGIADIFTKRKLDAATLEELEDVLIQADLGIDMASRITQAVAKGRYEKEIEPVEVRRILAAEVEKVLRPVEVPFTFSERERPFVVLVVGVNGSGKTTTIGKLGAIAVEEGYSVMLAACDTFRAAAIEQLEVWGERIGARVVSRPTGADASGLAFDALAEARREGTDIVFIDTAGRLQNKAVLMAELEKIVRVIKKQDASAPHAVLLVLDATTGQNAIAQAEVFTRIAGVTGIVMTKLDGTARGGILVAIAERFQLPVHAIGVGEGVKDLQPFDAALFARAIAGLDEEECA